MERVQAGVTTIMNDNLYLENASIDEDDARVLRDLVQKYGVKTVLEFGPGLSTGLFLSLGCAVTSFEHDPAFALEAQKLYPQARVFEYQNTEVLDLPLGESRFDLVFVDGPPAHLPHHPPPFARLNSTRIAAHHSKVIVLHDALREREQSIMRALVAQGASAILHPTLRGIAEIVLP